MNPRPRKPRNRPRNQNPRPRKPLRPDLAHPGLGTWWCRLPMACKGKPLAFAVHKRALGASLAVATVACIASVWALCQGDYPLAFADVPARLLGHGPAMETWLVQSVRGPRVLAGLVVGMALGIAGCLIQTLTRNRLASPETMGVNDGAMAAVIVCLIATHATGLGPWWLAPIGAAVAALAMVLLAGNNRFQTQGHRMLVVGLGLAYLLKATGDFAMSRQDLMHASALHTWSLGSFHGMQADRLQEAAPWLLGFALIGLCLRWPLRLALLSPDVAKGLGLQPGRLMAATVLCAVALAGLSVGLVGPIGFVALAAPILASRLAGPGTVPLALAGWVGATLTVTADTLGHTLLPDRPLPAGVITGVLGGPFLLWILINPGPRKPRSPRKGRLVPWKGLFGGIGRRLIKRQVD